MSRKIAIVGAGLVGSLWAVLLRRRGYEVELFEKRPDLRKAGAERGRSINLVVTSRGLHALGQAGLLEDMLKLSVPVFGRAMHGLHGEVSYQPYGLETECNYSISRSMLNGYLMTAAEAAGARISFGRELKDIAFGTRRLRFADGEAGYDLLFGADGAGSAVRRALVEGVPGAFTDSIEWLAADYKELSLPPGPGGSYRLKANALHIWPRGAHMMMALANLDGGFTVTVYLPKRGKAASFEAVKGEADVRALFARDFADAVPLMPDYVREFLHNPQGTLGTVRCDRWVHGGSVALLGDAAHGIVPFFGQGMNCGFEDCTELLAFLDEARGDWNAALARYDVSRRRDTDAIADMAVENWTEMRDKVGDPGFLLRKKVEGTLERAFPAKYKSRYGMIAYTRIPYSKAREAGRVQDALLAKLCENLSSVEQLDLSRAERLVDTEFVPFLEASGLRLVPAGRH